MGLCVKLTLSSTQRSLPLSSRGPTELTANTVASTGTVPTVTDNLAAQGLIDEASVGICEEECFSGVFYYFKSLISFILDRLHTK